MNEGLRHLLYAGAATACIAIGAKAAYSTASADECEGLDICGPFIEEGVYVVPEGRYGDPEEHFPELTKIAQGRYDERIEAYGGVVLGLQDVELYILPDENPFMCDIDEVKVSFVANRPASACYGAVAVVPWRLTQSALSYGASAEVYTKMSIDHEFGHHLQFLNGEKPPDMNSVHELEADCVAGHFAIDESAEYIANAQHILSQIGSDVHGSGEERVAAFQSGLDGSDCGGLLDVAGVNR